MPDEVHVDGGETPHRSPDVPREVQRLPKTSGIDAEPRFSNAPSGPPTTREQPEVAQAAFSPIAAPSPTDYVDDVVPAAH
jgi:hypothetical protein